MQTTANAATADKAAAKTVTEKLAEKRRALGRGLESLLPGPRALAAAPTPPQSARKDGAPATYQFAIPGSPETESSPSSSSSAEGGRAGTQAAVDQLQAAAAGQAPDGERAFELALDSIDRNPYQTRMEFDPKALGDLVASIQAQGVLQPVVVRPAPLRPGTEGRFVLILGERRFRASKMAGKATIPAIVKRVSEQQAAEMTLVENLQRQDLDCLEQAQAFANLSTEFNLTQEEIGNRVGVSREQVSNYLRLLRLPPTVLTALQRKELTYSHARLLLALRDDTQIAKVAQMVIVKKMSVALLQDLIIDIGIPGDKRDDWRPSEARWVDPNVRAAQRSLETVLGMRVRISDRKGKGKITIEYGNLEDFDRVVGMLRGK